MKSLNIAVGLVLFAGLVVCSYRLVGAQRALAQTEETGASPSGFAAMIPDNSKRILKEGQHTFRFDTFGDEAWWGDTLHLHDAIEGAKLGGIGPGVSPATALSLGLKVDLDALPASLVQQLKLGKVNLNDPAVTLALLKLNAVVGVTGHFNPDGSLKSVGIQCGLCHSTVDSALAPGVCNGGFISNRQQPLCKRKNQIVLDTDVLLVYGNKIDNSFPERIDAYRFQASHCEVPLPQLFHLCVQRSGQEMVVFERF
jgi:hypothetical protein